MASPDCIVSCISRMLPAQEILTETWADLPDSSAAVEKTRAPSLFSLGVPSNHTRAPSGAKTVILAEVDVDEVDEAPD